ncbi:hypothetical protein CHGG_00083 [Chaetomium globosum CBS 148.51]|uniref:DUF7371 domain-containing protein n=1 Tax=Chaetomium globosum (strain ATCC 6205 / CBS 148.51 / DSM 1962 / NBRC 6347 / NRRL 1970) TaxID=306901 RepID=Q2HI71_CHAGB|nr:uncharacterized protein CHGG_00083 [Chaetomium globosum CBS 148.51]EAQ91848.1 hypothetical protein CHGG_00083 [Chaetomium globosum CBS 148.51]
MRIRATLATLLGVSWLASAAVVPRLDISSESICSSTEVHQETTAPAETGCSSAARENGTTTTPTNTALASGQVTPSVTRLPPIPKAVTVTIASNDPSSAFVTASVPADSISANPSSLSWVGGTSATATPSLEFDSTVTVTVPKPVRSEATSLLTVTYPDGPGHTATLLVTVTIPDFSLGTSTVIVPAATPTSASQDVTVTIYVSSTLSNEGLSAWSFPSNELPSNTLDSEPTTTVTVYYTPTGRATDPASQAPYELTYTISPGSFLPTPFTGTITITPSSPVLSSATAAQAELDSGQQSTTISPPVPLAVVSTAGELDVSSSSVTLASTAVTMTYTAFISGSTTVTTVTEYPSLLSGTPVVTVLTPHPISNTLGSIPMIPLTITLTSEISTTTTPPQTTTSPVVETGGLDAEPVTATVTYSEPSNPSVIGAVPYGSSVNNYPDTTASSLVTSTAAGSLSILTITVPEASSDDSLSAIRTSGDSSAVTTVTEPARESRATPSSPVPIANTPSGTSSASVILVTYTVPGLSGSGPSSYVVTYTVQPSETASLGHESSSVTSSSSSGTTQLPSIHLTESSLIISRSSTQPAITITSTVSPSVSGSSSIDSSPTEVSSADPVFSISHASGYGAAMSSESISSVLVTVTEHLTISTSKSASSSLLPTTPPSSSEGATTGSDAGLPTNSGQYQYHTTGAVLPTSASDKFTLAPTTSGTLPFSMSVAVSTIVVTLTQTVPLGYGSSTALEATTEVTIVPSSELQTLSTSTELLTPINPTSTASVVITLPSTTGVPSSSIVPIQSGTAPTHGTRNITTAVSQSSGEVTTSIIPTNSISLFESGTTLGLASPPQTEFHHHGHAMTDNSISTLASTLGGYIFSESDSGYGISPSGYGEPMQTASSSSSQPTSGSSTPLPYGVTSITDSESYGINPTTPPGPTVIPSSVPNVTGTGYPASTTRAPVPVTTYPSSARNSTSTVVLSSSGPITTTPLFSPTLTSLSYSFTNPSPTSANLTTSTVPPTPVIVTYTVSSTPTSATFNGTVPTTAPGKSSTQVDATSFTSLPGASSSMASSNATLTASATFTSTANATVITSIPIIGTSVSVGVNTTTALLPTVSFSSATGPATNPLLGTTVLSGVVTTATLIPSVPPFPNISIPAQTSDASPTTLDFTTPAPTSFGNTVTGVGPSTNPPTFISVTGAYNRTTTAFHNNTTVVTTPTISAPFGNQTTPVQTPFLNNTGTAFTRSLISTLTSRTVSRSTAQATLISTPTVSSVANFNPRSLALPNACGMSGDRGSVVLKSVRLGCDSVHASCVFRLTGLQWNGVEDVIQGHTVFTIPACSNSFDCTLDRPILDPAAAPFFTNLTALNITLAAPSGVPTWSMDDLQIGWTDNDCVAAACRARVANTVATPRSQGSFTETARRLLRWAVRG